MASKSMVSVCKRVGLALLALMCMALLFMPIHARAEEEEPTTTGSDLNEQITSGNILLFGGGTEETGDPLLDEDYVPEDEDDSVDIQAVSGTGKVAKKDVNLRADASTDAEVLFTLSVGSKVEIMSEKDGWYFINFGIMQGYMRNDMVLLLDEEGRNGLVQRDKVKMRSTPTTEEDNVIFELVAGNNTQIIDLEMGLHDDMAWYKVRFSGHEGYVREDNMQLRGTFSGEAALAMLGPGTKGEEVTRMQKALISKGFMNSGEDSGTYDNKTQKAVKDFQKAASLEQDGIAGVDTLDKIYNSNIRKTIADKNDVKGKVQRLEWNTVNKLMPRGTKYKVIDVKTGISWNERRMGGWYHSDTEPVTAADTAKMKRTVGTWTWNRRPVWVVLGNRVIAASMNVMPHLGSTIKDNNFNGHHCIHFWKSKVHENSKECPRHQSCVTQAYNAGK